PQFAVTYYGVLRAGGVVVPMNPLLKGREVEYYLGDSGARHILAWHEFASEAAKGSEAVGAQLEVVAPGDFDAVLASFGPTAETATRAGSDTAIILCTSGTTGHPKGAELTHANMSRNAAFVAARL